VPDVSTIRVSVHTWDNAAVLSRTDALAIEEPLEIRLSFDDHGRRAQRPVSITMRTPGHDAELAAGFLSSEGILTSPDQVAAIHDSKSGQPENVVLVDLAPGVTVDLARLERHFYTTSSCGVCGKTSIEAIHSLSTRWTPLKGRPTIAGDTVCRLPDTLRAAQAAFDATGGLHAAALFDTDGQLLSLREDVGRHNAVDKLIGAEWLTGRVPLLDRILFLSGRASYELLQKALAAGIPIVAAVGAPSSLAVQLAAEFDITLLGFVRGRRFNIYSAPWRVRETEGLE
jgi:FdhD protein